MHKPEALPCSAACYEWEILTNTHFEFNRCSGVDAECAWGILCPSYDWILLCFVQMLQVGEPVIRRVASIPVLFVSFKTESCHERSRTQSSSASKARNVQKVAAYRARLDRALRAKQGTCFKFRFICVQIFGVDSYKTILQDWRFTNCDVHLLPRCLTAESWQMCRCRYRLARCTNRSNK